MKELQYLFTILYLQNSLCTIDINIPEYQYLSRSLTPEECKRLYASLHSTTFKLLAKTTQKNVPNLSCMQLLTKWDKGINKWEGRTKSHVDVVRRLRQIGRDDLAEWLSNSVLRRLEKAVNDALDAKFRNTTEEVQIKTYTDKSINDDWTFYDTISWAVLAGLVTSAVLITGRVIALCCRKIKLRKKAKEEEIMELLSYGTLDSDQETIYECVLKNNRFSENKNVTE